MTSSQSVGRSSPDFNPKAISDTECACGCGVLMTLGWQYHPETFPSAQKARSVANQLPIAWPIDLVPELRAA